MAKKILFVDDEAQILKALKRMIRGTDYDAVFFDNGVEALAYLETESVDLMITDVRMPKMDGIELLKIVKSKYPKTLRFALSGYTENKKIINAIDDNLTQVYMAKPWENKTLLQAISNVFELSDKLRSSSVYDIIAGMKSLPTLPKLYNDITTMLSNDESIDKIVKKIEEDPVVSLNILKVSNSAFYGSKTSSIHQATMVLGLVNVKSIIVGSKIFSGDNNLSKSLNLWEHASLTNTIANYIYEKIYSKKMPNESSTAGLFHSIGIILFITQKEKEYKQILDKKKSIPEIDIWELEREYLDTTHGELGSYLLNWWEFPYSLLEVSMYYRNPSNDNTYNTDVINIVHIASSIAWEIIGTDYFGYQIYDDVCACIGYDVNQINELIEYFSEYVKT